MLAPCSAVLPVLMLDHALTFLKDALGAHFRAEAGSEPAGSPPIRVAFPESGADAPLAFEVGAVTCLLLSIEDDAALIPSGLPRPGDAARLTPEAQVTLSVLFVARYAAYEHSLRALSRVLSFFHRHPVFTHDTAPSLQAEIDRIHVEATSLSASEHAALWASLGTPIQPARLYTVRVRGVRDGTADTIPSVADVRPDPAS